MRFGFLFVMLMLVVTTWLAPTKSFACNCLMSKTVQEEVANSDVIFSGKVKTIQIEDSATLPVSVVFQVDEVWKGIAESKKDIYTAKDSADCGVSFTKGNEYLVYGNENQDQVTTTLCRRTALLSKAQEDIMELGEGEKVEERLLSSTVFSVPMAWFTEDLLFSATVLSVVAAALFSLWSCARVKK